MTKQEGAREVVEGVELTDEEYFYLHYHTPYSLTSARMNAFLRGVDDGSKAMKQAVLKAIDKRGRND